ncbi:MAG: DNA polymerase III subunit alpha [bacterium]
MHGVADFVHLHVHTEYSLLDGMIKIPDLVAQAESFQMPAVAITDHGNLFGAIKFYEAMKEKGLKPIIGCEVYVAPNSRFDRDSQGNHLVLLCKNSKGYQNLCKLVSTAYREGFYFKPRIDRDLLAEYNEGLIALSACLKGEIPEALLEDDHDRALQTASFYKEVFDNNRFYLELQENGIEDQRRINRELLALGKRLELPVVATNDCHYLSGDLARAHEVLLCLQTQKTLSDDKRMKMATEEFYFRSPGEMKEKFAEVPEAVSNTLEIASRCNLDLNFHTLHFPRFDTPGDESLEKYLEDKARQGFKEKLPDIRKSDPHFDEREEEYQKRFDYELSIIKDMGFPGYFLIVADFVNYARSQGIPVGPGRGSAAGSFISYCLGITDLNPLAYGLIFERFLNPERREMPDIDIDFCQERREEVLRYVTDKYGGADYVAQIITFGTMKAKAVLRDVGRVLDMPYGDVDKIAKLIPNNQTLDQSLENEPRLKELRDKDPQVKELLSLARSLEGISRHASTHAAGVVISDKPLTDYLPLYKDPRSDDMVAQYDMKCVEKVGLIKFDLLGLKTLTQIKYCRDMIKDNQRYDLDPAAVDMDDAKTYELLASGDTGGVFQVESSGMRDLLSRLQPNCFEELIAVLALYRPGPINAGYVDKFIERKHGRQAVEYTLPSMEEVLKETYGLLIYQEQVMELAVKLAGYRMGEADTLRKAMGKKIVELMDTQKDKFISGAVKNNIPEDKAKQIFDDMAQFAYYGFNKSHAAVYAYVAYQTAYLKAHYPVEFMASLMTMDMQDTDKIMNYLRECEQKGIAVDPPDVNSSLWRFRALEDRVCYGLGAVKGVGEGAVEAIIEARQEKPFSSLFDFCNRVDLRRVNKKTIESLIKGGAFDKLGTERSRLMAALDKAMEKGHQAARERETGQASFFDFLGESAGDDYATESFPEVDEWSSTELLANEREALGLYLTGHPLARYEKMMHDYGIKDTASVPFMANGQEVLVGGIVEARKETMTKKKGKQERMAFITLSDLTGRIEVVVFANVYKDVLPYLDQEELPLLVRGRVGISGDKAKILASEIFPLEEASERLSIKIHLTLNRPQATAEQVDYLASVLKRHRGKAQVIVHVVIPGQSETLVSLPPDYSARPDQELIRAMEEMLGEEAVRMVAA